MNVLSQISYYLPGSLLIAAFVAAAMGGLIAFKRLSNLDLLKQHHDVAGNMMTVGGTLYGVLLGLVVVDAIGTFATARTTVEKEADALSNLALMAERLPADKSAAIKSKCIHYISDVIDREWSLMGQGKLDELTQNSLMSLLREIAEFEPVTEGQKAAYSLLLQQSIELRDQRRTRIGISLNGLPAVEWVVLVAGAVITIVLTYFFYLGSFPVHLAMTGLISLLIALNLYLVVLFAAPFTGDLTVTPDVLKYVLGVIRTY